MTIFSRLILLMAITLCGSKLLADEALPTGTTVIETQKKRNSLATESTTYDLTLIDRRDRETKRTMVVKIQDDGATKMLLKFLQPADIRNVGLLTWTESGTGDTEESTDQWMYLPSLKRVKRIAGGSKKSLFMGTDLAYEDFHAENLKTHAYKNLGEETREGVACWKIESTPSTEQEKSDSGYGRRVLYVQKDTYVTIYAELYDPHEKLIKTVTYSDLVQVKGDAWRPNKLVYHRPMQKTTTVVEMTDRKIDVELPDSTFTQQELKRPSAE